MEQHSLVRHCQVSLCQALYFSLGPTTLAPAFSGDPITHLQNHQTAKHFQWM